MRIAFLTPEFATEKKDFDGGLANYLYRTSLGLVEFGHEPHVFVPGESQETFSHNGITVHRVEIGNPSLLFRIRHLTYRSNPTATKFLHYSWHLNKDLRKVNEKVKFDVVQYASYGLMAYYRLTNIPAVVRISSWEKRRREVDTSVAPTREQLELEELEQTSIHRADGIFGPSNQTAKLIENEIGKHIQVIPSPFFLDTQDTDESLYQQKLAGKKYLLFFGSIRELKGAHIIGEILPDLLKKHKDLYFVFVGKSFGLWERMEPELKEVADRVVRMDKLSHQQLYPVIKHAYAAVLPSLYDNFANVCLESMGLGTIVVGTIGASFDEIITDGKDGILVARDDSKSLRDGVERLLKMNNEEYKQMRKNALVRIQDFSLDKLIPPLLDYYNKVIEIFNSK